MSVSTAFTECQSLQISTEKDWHQLSSSEKAMFLELARDHNYRDPKNASGRSKGYCFYLALQRKQTQFEQG